MRILPVLDLKGGQIVRGRAGRRHEYAPVRSLLAQGSAPLTIARAFRDHLGLAECYLADLDAIAGAEPAWKSYASLQADGFRLWVDAGIRHATGARTLATSGIAHVVIGFETVAGPAQLATMAASLGKQAVFSLDLLGGQPFGKPELWRGPGPWSIAVQAVDLGITRILVIDLARVGANDGTGTEDFCRRLRTAFPSLELTAGGGVRDRQDLLRLRQCGVDNVLVASAFHDGRMGREDVQWLASEG